MYHFKGSVILIVVLATPVPCDTEVVLVDEVLSETQKPHPYIKNSKEYCKVKKILENYCCSTLFELHPAWVIDVMNIYGEDILRTLADFIYNYVFDLHSSNYGWLQGKPVIFDYAGFED